MTNPQIDQVFWCVTPFRLIGVTKIIESKYIEKYQENTIGVG